MTEQPFLRIERLWKRFGAFTALKAIDLEVRRGEFVCFLGPSGCGKTTLLRAIAGLDPQDEGRIEIAGRDVSRAAAGGARLRHRVPVLRAVPEPDRRAATSATASSTAAKGAAEIKRRVDELLALVGLPEQDRKYPAQLSGGQQQRVALARALATSPGLLLLDEPLSALDAKVRVRLRDEIRALQRRLGVTTIMVTHDQEEALAMADRIVVMNHGVIEQVGTPAEIYRSPATAFVADFVGTMNFLDATVAGPERIRVGALELVCNDDRGLHAGTAVQLGLRPEEIRVRDIEAERRRTRSTVQVGSLEFLGAFCRARLTPEVETAGAARRRFLGQR